LLALLGLACEREPLEEVCPDVQAGGLVLTELRGPQTGSDTYGQWIELLNATGDTIELRGVQIIFTPGDGSDPLRLIVRRELEVDAGAYVVLGRADLDEVPAHMDYGFGPEFDGGLDPSGVVEVEVCDEVVDRFVYLQLPVEGSYAFDGSKSVDAEVNDDESCWCADTTEAPPDGPMTDIGLPGTPGEENHACP
jgi:hypothetical protein